MRLHGCITFTHGALLVLPDLHIFVFPSYYFLKLFYRSDFEGNFQIRQMSSLYEDKECCEVGLSGELAQVNSEELEFDYLFNYEPPDSSFPSGDLKDDTDLPLHSHPYPLDEPSPYSESSTEALSGYEHLEPKNYIANIRSRSQAVSPRIEITPSREHHSHGHNSLHDQLVNASPRPTLTVPGLECSIYREPQCLSPASSNSSTSWHSETYSPFASPCVSPGSGQAVAGELCPRLQNIHTGSPRTSPGTSPHTSLAEDHCSSPRPSSRSTSPQGKRTYDMYRNPNRLPPARSRSPSPCGCHDDHRPGPHYVSSAVPEVVNGMVPGSVPSKIVRSNQPAYTIYPDGHGESYRVEQDFKTKTEQFFIPTTWQQLVPGICSIPIASLPPLEWPLPRRTDQYELHIEVQPKPHHRAHYETEGSRGAVKAPTGGHPVVQLHGYRGKDPLGLQIFIGTADERILKPHAFYQVHRITGKTVTTTSYEKTINSTKVLEIPLEPKNNMKAIIDCAGILKLRNADIELRKGETDIGRKNTRVRLVFRIHIPQPGGQYVSLQVASHPIECSQRSAHELPMVEKQDMDSCSVLGGQQMILTGQNFSADSKVIFTEKNHDGQQIWELEATVDKDKSQASMLFIEVPPYRDPTICHPAKVNFYVINGKRKRSQPQHFTYTHLPVSSIKTEPLDEYESGHIGYMMSQTLGVSPHSYYLSSDNGLLPNMTSCHQNHSGISSSEPCFQQHIVYPRAEKNIGPSLYIQTGVMVPEAHRSVLVHTGSPAKSSHLVGQHPVIQFSPTNQNLLRGENITPPGQKHQNLYCEGYSPQGTQTAVASRSAAAAQAPQTQQYPTIIQQQPYTNRIPKDRSPPGEVSPQRCSSAEEQRASLPGRVTVKQENLDQAYLDDVNEIIRKDLTGVHGRGQT
ncbi:nuclear factor of activated T-cells, cytoplasmic 2 isoform X1 [Silurus meridionalis]|uniref:nuclear factor of activated T-cells, cytoplasmic 2 isoform X1 n=1 Tax=Silurus meridionalis TaxID=175797 RepID=UPI001EEC71DE|nr:nuclear factor of activated T-cells, cytoplasmic 2 isoform X1 [Silurus meridionalis]